MQKDIAVEAVAKRLGTWARHWRKQHGWSQGVLGHETYLAEKTIARVEKGEAPPDLTTIVRLYQAFGEESAPGLFEALFGAAVDLKIQQGGDLQAIELEAATERVRRMAREAFRRRLLEIADELTREDPEEQPAELSTSAR